MSDKRDRKDSSDFSNRNPSRSSNIDQRHYQSRQQYDDDRRYNRNSQGFYDKPRNNDKYHQSSYSNKSRGFEYPQGYDNRRSSTQSSSSSNSALNQNSGPLPHRGRSPYESSRHLSRYNDSYEKERSFSVSPGTSIDSDGMRDRRKKIDDYSNRRKSDYKSDDSQIQTDRRFDDRESNLQSYRHDDRRYDNRRFDERRYDDSRYDDDRRYDDSKGYDPKGYDPKGYDSRRRYDEDLIDDDRRYDDLKGYESRRRYDDDLIDDDRRYDDIKGYESRRRYDDDFMDDEEDDGYYSRRSLYQKQLNGSLSMQDQPRSPRKSLPADIVQPVEIGQLSFNPG